MKRFEAQKAFLAGMFILGVFIILPGCSGGAAGGGSWDKPTPPATPPVVTDTTAPRLVSTGSSDGDIDLPINNAGTATFSEPMDPATLVSPATNYTVKETLSGANVDGVVTYIGTTATFKPNGNLKTNTQYTSTITAGAKDLSGNALTGGLRPNPWKWTTLAVPPFTDTAAPLVTVANPANLATNVPVDKKINVTFNEAMIPATMTIANYSVKETVSGTAVSGTVAYDVLNHIATFSPLANLKPDTDFTVAVTNAAQDLAGNALVVPAVNGLNPWSFKTSAAAVPVAAPLAINLGKAAAFGLASQAGLTSTGVTVVNGDIALYPLAKCTDATGGAGSASQDCLTKVYSSPTGMTVNGSLYWAGDPFDNGVTAQAVTTDLNVAWVEGKNKVDTQPAIAGGQLASPTPYVPGVYHNANLGLAAGGIAILDARNDANAIFIFKVDSDFVDSGTLLLPSRIVLINGAQARNIWFVAGRDITIGSGTTWNGNILAGRTATVKDGSTVNGRVLAGAAGAGAITLTGAAAPSVTTVSVPQ